MKRVPEEIQNRLVTVAAHFKIKTGASFDDINEFMIDIIQIYSDYMDSDLEEVLKDTN